MKRFQLLLLWEIRRLVRARAVGLVLGGLLAAGGLALWSGHAVIVAQRAAADRLPAHYAAQMERIAAQFPAGGDAGYVAYYTFFPTHNPPPPLAALATGVREVAPDVLWIRLFGLEGQLYESGLGNPATQALGGFDLAFVIVVLAPLALLGLTHDALTRDRAAGRLPLLVAQAGSPVALLAVRVGLRALAVMVSVVVMAAGGAVWLGASGVDTLAWLGAAGAYLAFWAGAAGLIAGVARTPAASLAAALTTWVVLVVLAPALLNLALTTAYPVAEGIEITVSQRQEMHGGWDQPKDATFEKFYQQNPDWSGAPPVTGRFAWRWYYAMHQVADEAVATESHLYRAHLRTRQASLTRAAWVVPPVYGQLLLGERAGTDLGAHLAYLDRVRAFHAGLRAYFYPMVFAQPERTLHPADYAAFPQFAAVPSEKAADRASAAPLLFLCLLLTSLAGWLVHRRPLLA
jgi:ABC-2 type transport system permease protein